MSAIAGIVHFDGRPRAEDDLARLMRSLAPLGPDREASWHDETVALGFCQTTLLPEDRFDRQPWHGRAGGLTLVANARLDNRDELADALGIAESERRTLSDSALLLRAFERWSDACIDRLDGDFTFAVWDKVARRLFCARSHVAGPPLYYHLAPKFFAFATTANALFALPEVPRALDDERLAMQLALMSRQGPVTFYRDIVCLPPGHRLTVTDGILAVERYWRLDTERRLRLGSDDDYVAAFRECFDRAVAVRLRSLHPIGSHLSAGCDSTAVTVTAARLLAAGDKGLTAFTAAPAADYRGAAPRGRIVDETSFAAEIAASLPNVAHVVVRSDERTPLDGLDRSHLLYGRPMQNPCNAVWAERILDVARHRRIKVLLTGQLGNMSISYDGLHRLATLLRRGQFLTLSREIVALRHAGIGRGQLIDRTISPYFPQFLWRRWAELRAAPNRDVSVYSAINPEFAAEIDLASLGRRRRADHILRPGADGRAVRRMMMERQDGGDYRNGYLAGWGIDQRDPTSDRRLLEFCLAIPEDQFLRHGKTKFLYRRAFANTMPAATIAARKRGYQGADWHVGLTAVRDQVAAELDRLEKSPRARRVIDLPRLRRLIENWPRDGWHENDVIMQYRLILLHGLTVGKFIRWVEGGNQ